jgi:hypothetical protein
VSGEFVSGEFSSLPRYYSFSINGIVFGMEADEFHIDGLRAIAGKYGTHGHANLQDQTHMPPVCRTRLTSNGHQKTLKLV